MGLDMYLCRHKREANTEPREIIENVNSFNESVVYWRKANQIRGWFASNLADFEDNGKTLVTEEDLDELIGLVNHVLACHADDLAKELLPPTDGFFFGGTEIDEYYWETLKTTAEELNLVRDDTDFKNEFLYYYEWY